MNRSKSLSQISKLNSIQKKPTTDKKDSCLSSVSTAKYVSSFAKRHAKQSSTAHASRVNISFEEVSRQSSKDKEMRS